MPRGHAPAKGRRFLGAELTGGKLLMGHSCSAASSAAKCSPATSRWSACCCRPRSAPCLPTSALAIDRRIAVNLNYTVSADVMNECIAQCGIRHVLTSPRLLERFPLKIDAEIVHLEDLRRKITRADKLIAAAQAWLLPAAVLERWLGLTRRSTWTIC